MMKATFDPSIKISLHHRQGASGSKKIIFKNPDESPYDISAIDFRLKIGKSPHGQDPLELTVGDGLTKGGAGSNELTIDLAPDDPLWTGKYFWQLINDTIDRTWLNGPFLVHDGEFESFTGDLALTIYTDGGNIEVTITDSGAAALTEIDGGNATT